MRSSSEVAVYLEMGKKRTFAGAMDWPGWCRGGRDQATALQALFGTLGVGYDGHWAFADSATAVSPAADKKALSRMIIQFCHHR